MNTSVSPLEKHFPLRSCSFLGDETPPGRENEILSKSPVSILSKTGHPMYGFCRFLPHHPRAHSLFRRGSVDLHFPFYFIHVGKRDHMFYCRLNPFDSADFQTYAGMQSIFYQLHGHLLTVFRVKYGYLKWYKTRPTASSHTTSSNRISRGIPSLGDRVTNNLYGAVFQTVHLWFFIYIYISGNCYTLF